MNRLAVVRSARAQQAHKVNNRINWLMPFLKTDTDTQNRSTRSEVLFRSRQTHSTQHTDKRHTHTDPNPRSAESQLWQTMRLSMKCQAHKE